MKKHRFNGGLFATPQLITTRCSYLTNNITNTNNYTPPLSQAQLLAIQPAPGKKSNQLLRSGLFGLLWLWTLARFYSSEKRRRIPTWQLEDLALLKIIKTNALRRNRNVRSESEMRSYTNTLLKLAENLLEGVDKKIRGAN